MKTKAFSPSNVLTYATILVSLVCVLGPFLWLIGISLKTRTQILTNPPLFIWKPTFENYAQVLHTDNFLQSLGNSVIISVSTVILSLLIGVPAAYTMARSRFRGRGTMYYSLLLMRMLPGIAVLIPMFMLFEYIGLQGSRSSVVFAHLSFSLPLVVWVMRSFFAELPAEIEESARVDGATRFQVLSIIVLPLARPGMTAIATLCFLLSWNDFIFAAVLSENATQTLPVLLASYSTADNGIDWGQLSAAGVLAIAPVILLSAFAQKHLVAGLSAGATKG